MLKRVCAALLSLALLLLLAVPASAEKTNKDPIIMIAGYTSTQLFSNPATPEKREHVWNPDFNAIGMEILKELPGLLGGALLYSITGNNKIICDAFSRAAKKAVGYLALDIKGKPVADVGPWSGKASQFSQKAIAANKDPNAVYLNQLGNFRRNFAKAIGDDRVFVFQYDWRNPTVLSAKHLDAFIQEVKALTGSRKVRIFASSYGGQISTAYLYDYAKKNDVSKIVMEIPAIQGSTMIGDLVQGKNFSLQTEAFTRFMQSYMDTEVQLDPILKSLNLKLLYPLVTDLLQTGLVPVVETWGSLWDLIPANAYDSAKKTILKGKRYAWEPYSDRLHHEIMPAAGKLLREAKANYGIDVRIVADSGYPHLLGDYKINSDGLLDLKYTTGAYVLPLGEHGIKQSNKVCKTAGHRHISPGQDIDASAAWLPDHTWFVQRQFHGSSLSDPYALALETALMLDSSLNTVYDNPDFPQFGRNHQPCENIDAVFDGKVLTIENLSQERSIRVTSISAPGLKFSVKKASKTAPGKSIGFTCESNTIKAGAYTPITIRFLQYNNGIPVQRSKTFDY